MKAIIYLYNRERNRFVKANAEILEKNMYKLLEEDWDVLIYTKRYRKFTPFASFLVDVDLAGFIDLDIKKFINYVNR